MKQTRRISLLLAVVLLLGLCLAGCSEATTTEPVATGDELSQQDDQPQDVAPQDIQWGQVYLCGEWHHGDAVTMETELALWGELYAQGWRDLFEEMSYADAYYLNRWMQEDSDETMDWWYHASGWYSLYGNVALDYYRQIKQNYPETVFHGVDVVDNSVGGDLKAELYQAGKEDTEEFKRVMENLQQTVQYNRLDGDDAKVYRENCMAENFLREYGKLSGANIMGIFGSAHVLNCKRTNGLVDTMAKQLMAYGGDAIQTDIIGYPDLIRTDRMQVRGKEYDATYYGADSYEEKDGTLVMEYWRLEDAYEDLADCPYAAEDETFWAEINYFDFPLKVEEGQVYVVQFTQPDGTVERDYYRADGNVIDNYVCVQCIVVDD